MKERLKDFGLVTLGSIIMAVSFNTMFVEHKIASGGVGGLAIIINAIFGVTPADFILYANIPLLLICFLFLGKSVFIKTAFGAIFYPLCIKMTQDLPNITDNPLLAAIFGGIILGFGLGLIFLGNSSTGGTGIIIQLINKYTPLSLGFTIAIVDGLIVGLGFIVFDPDVVMHSIVALAMITYVVNHMMTGANSLRNVMIISKDYLKIKQHIRETVDRGVTELPMIGGFSGKEMHMLMTTVSIPEFQKLESGILDIDKTAFIIVMPASQVQGKGFSIQKDHEEFDEDYLVPM